MQTGFQNSNKSSETSSINNKNRTESLSSNYQQNQAVLSSMGEQNMIGSNIIQHKLFSMRNDSRHDVQKCSTASCSASKNSTQTQKQKDSQIEKEKINTDHLITKIAMIKKEQKKSNKYSNIHQDQKINMKEEDKIEQLKVSLYGKRFFIGKGSISIGQQGKQQIVAFLGLFLPIVCFILYEIQYSQGLRSQSKWESWLICVIFSSVLSFILFIYCSISNPGFIAVPLTQKQRHTLPVVQQKGKKEFDLRYCYTCHIYRPLRTHHCKICDLCVTERDHHCPFLNNCIGYYNRRGYVYFLFFVVLGELLIISETLFQIIYPFVEDEDFVKTIQRIPVILAIIQCIYASILAANLLSLLIFQFQLIAKNRTTDEFRRLIVPDPKPIDIELNQEFDYGCLSNFQNVLFCKNPPEPIYANFDKLNKDYLIHRYNYYLKKKMLSHNEEEEQGLNDQFVKINMLNNPMPSNTQYPLQLDNQNNQNFTSVQSKPSFSPLKLGLNNLGLPNYFPSSTKGQQANQINQLNQQNINQINNQNSNRIIDKESSPTGFNSEVNNFNQINNSNISSLNANKNDQTTHLTSQLSKNSHIQNLANMVTQIDNLQNSLQFNQNDNKEVPIFNNDLNHNQKQGKIHLHQQKLSQITKVNSKSSDEEIQKVDQGIQITKIFQNIGSQPSNQGLETIPTGRLLNNSDKRGIETNEITIPQLITQNSKLNNQLKTIGTQDFDSNVIIYDLKPLEDSQIQQNQKRTFTTSLSKSQYYSTKITENNTQNMLISNSTVTTSQQENKGITGQSQKVSIGFLKQEAQSINFNDDEEEDESNSSYIEQKPNHFEGIKNLQNNNNVASSRRFNGIKKLHSEMYNPQQLLGGDNSPNFNNKYMHQQKSSTNYYKNQNHSEQSSTTQVYLERENGGKDFSRITNITATLANNNINNNKNNNFNNQEDWKLAKGIYFDPSQEQSTDVQTAIHDQQSQQMFLEKLPTIINPCIEKQNNLDDQDDFNIPQTQNLKQNKQMTKQLDGQKRNRKLFQNVQKHAQQTGFNSVNNSFISTDVYPGDNLNHLIHSNSLYYELNNENSKKQVTLNNQIQMQPQSKNFKLSPTHTNGKHLL